MHLLRKSGLWVTSGQGIAKNAVCLPKKN